MGPAGEQVAVPVEEGAVDGRGAGDRGHADLGAGGGWLADGGDDPLAAAGERVREILGNHYPNYLDPAIDAALRERFPIRLAPEAMSRDSRRW